MDIRKPTLVFLGIVVSTIFALSTGVAQDRNEDEAGESPEAIPEQRMTAERLAELILRIDEEAVLEGTMWLFHVEGIETAVVYDIAADRMRIIIPIGDSEALNEQDLRRMMQANFDSALDARYAVAQGTLWGVFIHPLSTLSADEFLVGLGQTVNVVMSYGSSYSSGLFIYGNGDSAEIERRRLIDRLRETET